MVKRRNMATMIDDPFWPEKQITPPEKLEATVAALTEALTLLKENLAACSDLYTPRMDDSELLRYIRLGKSDHEKALEAIRQCHSIRDNDMHVTKLPPSKLVVALKGKSNQYWPEIWTTPPEEIEEKLTMIQEELSLLKEKLACEPGLFIPIDDDICLLRFLRARKYDHRRTLTLIQNYFRIRATHSQLFKNFLPSAIWKTFSQLSISLSPSLDPQGRIIAILQAGKWDPATVSPEDVFRSCVLAFETASFMPIVQVVGIVGIMDLKGIKLMHVVQFSPYLLLRFAETLLKSFPLKVKCINIVNNPAVFSAVYSIIKPFLGQKMQSRIHFHGTRMESLHKQIPPEFLPADYGGYLEAVMTDGSVELTLQEENRFRELQRYGYTSGTEAVQH